MPKIYRKSKRSFTENEFLKLAKQVAEFKSEPEGMRYLSKVEGNIMKFRRMDALSTAETHLNLKSVFAAYLQLNNFTTTNFKPYVSGKQSPARALLFHLGMIE